MRILGIDPGSTLIGFGVVEERGHNLRAVEYGKIVIKEKLLNKKLAVVSKEIAALVKRIQPDAIGLEKLFFSKNRKTALEVAQARGVIVSELMALGLKIAEFTPGEVKVAVTNYGQADKEMVRKMVLKILDIQDFAGDDNVSDALAIAIATANKERAKY